MDTNTPATQLPSVSLVLTLDPFSDRIVTDLYKHYLASNPAYKNIRLLSLQDRDQAYTLVDLERGSNLIVPPYDLHAQINFGSVRQEAYRRLIGSMATLRQGLEIVLHEIRAHPRLLQSGLSQHIRINLNIILVGDITDPHTSGLLFPVLAILQNLLVDEPYSSVMCLLRVAQFPQAATTESENPEILRASQLTAAGVYVALQELDDFMRPVADGFKQQVALDLGMHGSETGFAQIFLFDRRKEGSLEVQDEDELSTLMGNFCLTLLSGSLTERLVGSNNSEISSLHPGYSSAAASALLYTPEPLIQACSAWLGKGFLAEAIPEERSPDTALVADLTKRILPSLGTISAWLERGCEGIPFQPVLESRLPALAVHLDGPGFNDLPPKCWADNLRQYRDQVLGDQLPAYIQSFINQTGVIQNEKLEILKNWLHSFVQDGLGMGAGYLTLTRAVQEVEGQILCNMQDLLSFNASRVRCTPAEIEAALQTLEHLAKQTAYRPNLRSLHLTIREEIASLRSHPKSFRNLRAWLSRVLVRWLQRGELQMIAARERCLQMLEYACLDRFVESTTASLAAIGEVLQGPVLQCYEDIDNLQETFHQAYLQFVQISWEAQSCLLHEGSLFRPNVISADVFRWASARWQPIWDDMCIALIYKLGLLNDWRQVTPQTLVERLQAYSRIIYEPGLADLSLSEVLEHTEGRSPLAWLSVLNGGSIPLMRANFDRLGGGASTCEIQAVESAERHMDIRDALATLTGLEWEISTTADRRPLLVYRIRQGIPLQAFHELLRQGKKAWEDLDEDQRSSLILMEQAPIPQGGPQSNGRYRTTVG